MKYYVLAFHFLREFLVLVQGCSIPDNVKHSILNICLYKTFDGITYVLSMRNVSGKDKVNKLRFVSSCFTFTTQLGM